MGFVYILETFSFGEFIVALRLCLNHVVLSCASAQIFAVHLKSSGMLESLCYRTLFMACFLLFLKIYVFTRPSNAHL